MGINKTIRDTRGYEAQVDDTLKALQVKMWPASTNDIDDIITELQLLNNALASDGEDELLVKVTDGTLVIDLIQQGEAAAADLKGFVPLALREATGKWEYLRQVKSTDSDATKGTYVTPVVPMTRQTEEGTRIHTNDACFVVAYEVEAVEAKTVYVLIDLSDAANYPHTAVNEIHVDWISFSMLGDVSAEGHVKVGFVTAIDAEKGTVRAFLCKPIDKQARSAFISRQYSPSAVRCKTAAVLSGGGMLITDDTTFQNDTALAGTYAAVIPAVGDLVMLIDRVAGSFDTVSVVIGYHTI